MTENLSQQPSLSTQNQNFSSLIWVNRIILIIIGVLLFKISLKVEALHEDVNTFIAKAEIDTPWVSAMALQIPPIFIHMTSTFFFCLLFIGQLRFENQHFLLSLYLVFFFVYGTGMALVFYALKLPYHF